jgi:transcriptional regulator with XRE-family HTH domain
MRSRQCHWKRYTGSTPRVAGVKIVVHRKEINARFFVVKTLKGHKYVFFMRPSVCRHVLVKLRRELNDLRQKELADIVGCSTSTIKRIELGNLKLSRRLARKLSEALGVSMNYLLANDLRKRPVTDSGEPWTREIYDRLPGRSWRNLDPYERVWKLLYSGMLISRFQEYWGMINCVPNPLEAAWKLSKKLEKAYVAFLREYPPAFAVLKHAQNEPPFKPVAKKYEVTKRSLKEGYPRDYAPRLELKTLIEDVRELAEAEESAREANSPWNQGRSGHEGIHRYLLACGLEKVDPYQVREYVDKLGDRLNPKERALFLSLCGPEDIPHPNKIIVQT